MPLFVLDGNIHRQCQNKWWLLNPIISCLIIVCRFQPHWCRRKLEWDHELLSFLLLEIFFSETSWIWKICRMKKDFQEIYFIVHNARVFALGSLHPTLSNWIIYKTHRVVTLTAMLIDLMYSCRLISAFLLVTELHTIALLLIFSI